MRLSETKLRGIVKEEIQKVLKEINEEVKVRVTPFGDYYKNNPSKLDNLAVDFRGEKVGSKTYKFPSMRKAEAFQDEVMHHDPKAGFRTEKI